MKIFVILPRIPYPLEKGDKLRAFNHIKFLSANHEIILCALNETRVNKQDAFQSLQPYIESVTFLDLSWFCRTINLFRAFFNGKPLQIGYFYSKKAHRKINRLIKENKPNHIFCQLLRTAEYGKNQPVPKTLDYQDVFSKGIERRIKTSPFYLRPFLKMEYKRLLTYERMIFDHFDNKTIISIPDRDLIPHPEKKKIEVIRNGVDTEFFKPMKHVKKFDLVFTGNMAYPPNVNSVEFLAYKILPLLKEKYPHIKILISGATPDKRVRDAKNENVFVSGWVDDIRESYASAKIFIAAMQIGTGLQNKLLEAMAMRIPCITSSLANQALAAKEGIEILVGENPEDYVEHICKLLDDEKYADQLAENGYKFVKQNYNWKNATVKLEKLMQETSVRINS